MRVRTTQGLNYGGQESKTTTKTNKRTNKQFAVYDSDTSVTLKQGQDNQTWYELVHPKQDYDNAKFGNPRLNSIHKKANDKVLIRSGNTSITSLEYVRESKNVTCS